MIAKLEEFSKLYQVGDKEMMAWQPTTMEEKEVELLLTSMPPGR